MYRTLRSIGFALFVSGALFVAGCDDATGPNVDGDTTFEGRVTDDAGFGKSAAEVEGAVVTASSVTADGSLNRLEGQATTNAQGRFELAAQDAADEVVVAAEKSGFSSKAMVFAEGRSRVQTMPLTAESHGEAEVFIRARQQDDEDEVTMSDVAVYVTKEVAAEARTDAQTASEVAATIVAEARTRKDFIREEDDGDDVEDARERENEAFVQFQTSLSASASSSAEATAVEAFERALIEAYAQAGVSAGTQAKARQAARSAVVRFSGSLSSEARFHLRKKAEILAAMATANAVEASFQASGATSARLNALQQAHNNLIARLRAATSVNALAEARAEYESKVEDELAAEIGVDAAIITSAGLALGTAKTTLELALATAASARAVSQAHATFYASAETAARATLDGSSKADLGATVLALLSADAS